MKIVSSNWSLEEMKVYLMLYCFSISKYKLIYNPLLKVQKLKFIELTDEFNKDNDYQSIQKLYHYFSKNNYSSAQINKLFNDITQVLNEYRINQPYWFKNLFTSLERTLKNAA